MTAELREAMVGKVTGLQYYNIDPEDATYLQHYQLMHKPDESCAIPNAALGDAFRLDVWHIQDRTYVHAAGEFMEQEMFWLQGLHGIGPLLEDYLADTQAEAVREASR